MSTDTENGVASAKDEGSREAETEEKKEKKTPRKRAAPVEKKEGERKSERAPKQSTPFKPPEPKEDTAITVPAGKGTPIGDIPNCVTALKAYKAADKFVGKLHRLMFGTGGKKRDFKQNIRLFKGFAPGEDKTKLVKKFTISKLEMKDLKPICHVLDLERSGTRDELIESIVDFLMEPKSSGKAYKKEVASSSGSKKKGQKRKASSKKKDKESTPRAPSGYMTFVKEKRASVVAKHPEAKFGEIGSLLGKKWNKLSDSEKAEWTEKGRKLGPSKKAKSSSKKDKKKKSSSKKSKKEESSSSDEASGSESSSEEEEEALSEGIRTKIRAIIAAGAEQLTIRQVKEQLKKENFADEVEKKGAEIKKFVHKCVESQ